MVQLSWKFFLNTSDEEELKCGKDLLFQVTSCFYILVSIFIMNTSWLSSLDSINRKNSYQISIILFNYQRSEFAWLIWVLFSISHRPPKNVLILNILCWKKDILIRRWKVFWSKFRSFLSEWRRIVSLLCNRSFENVQQPKDEYGMKIQILKVCSYWWHQMF